MTKIRIALLFGGRSAEHEVSLQSARNIFSALDKEKYDVTLIGIDQEGKWHLDIPSQLLLERTHSAILSDTREVGKDLSSKTISLPSLLSTQKEEKPFDVVFPILHGPYGEDGTIQGLLKLANIPFVGASVLGSAIGMDKDVMKRLLRDAQIPVAKFIVAHTSSEDDEIPSFDVIVRQLGLPFFVKPANLGSSVGISKVRAEEEYRPAVKKAFQFDKKILMEEAVTGREIEVSVLGNDHPVASIAGEIKTTKHEFYDYDAKYIDEKGAEVLIPADVTKRELDDLQYLAIKTYKTLCCEGMARVDFFLTGKGKVYVNEINTIPGFTNSSMYPKLWEASGIQYADLIDRLIQLALERHKKDASLQSTRH